MGMIMTDKFRFKVLDISTGEYIYYCNRQADAQQVIDVWVHISEYRGEPKHFDEFEIQETIDG